MFSLTVPGTARLALLALLALPAPVHAQLASVEVGKMLLVYVEGQLDYAVAGITTILKNNFRYLDVRADVQARYNEVIQKRLTALGGDGGVIAITPDGTMAWSFNSVGMYRARAADGQAVQVGIYKDER